MEYKKFNTKIKVYPDNNFKATYCNKFIFSPSKQIKSNCEPVEDWEKELRKEEDKYSSNDNKENQSNVENSNDDKENQSKVKNSNDSNNHNNINLERSLKRAKNTIFDIVYINDFKYFFTLTLNKEKIDRYDVTGFMKKLRNWLNNQKKSFQFEYILVPEYHKDGAIHVHGLMTDTNMLLLDSGKRTSKGQIIYNCPSWKYGFTTFIPVFKTNNSNVKLAHYITKYITKDCKKIFGKFYWSSKGLKREVDTEYFISDYDSLPLKEYEIPNTNIKLKYDSQFIYNLGGDNNEKKG